MIKNTLKIGFIVSFFTILAACSQASDPVSDLVPLGSGLHSGNKPVAVPAPTLAPNPSSTPAPVMGLNPLLIGKWQSACKLINDAVDDAPATSMSEQMLLGSDATMEMTTIIFQSANCDSNSKMQTFRSVGKFGTTDLTIAPLGGLKTFVTYFDQQEVDDQNAQVTCGASDWKLGVEHLDCSSQVSGDGSEAKYSLSGNQLSVTSCDSETCATDVYVRDSKL